MTTKWSIERWSDKNNGSRGISIKSPDGSYVANMVGQPDDSELSIARRIVDALNREEEQAKAEPS